MNRVCLLRSVIVSLVLPAVGLAQDAATRFEVASVRLRAETLNYIRIECPNGRLVTDSPLGPIITWAYSFDYPQTIEVFDQMPSWAKGAEHSYRIDAKAASPVPEAQCRSMLKELLAERFKLVVHFDVKQETFRVLVVGPIGIKLQPSEDGIPGVNVTVNGNLRRRLTSDVWSGMTMPAFAESLAGAGRSWAIVDQTGLEGSFKINLTYSTDPLNLPGPDLDTALQKQLGLKLEQRKGPVEHFVLDHIKRPDSN